MAHTIFARVSDSDVFKVDKLRCFAESGTIKKRKNLLRTLLGREN